MQSEGHRFRTDKVTLLVERGEVAAARVGFTVSRRVGNSVVRNRVRRRLREIVRLHQEVLVPGVEYVIVGAPSAAMAAYHALEVDLVKLLGAARAWVVREADASDCAGR